MKLNYKDYKIYFSGEISILAESEDDATDKFNDLFSDRKLYDATITIDQIDN